MKLSAPIFKLKRQAKLLSRDSGIALHVALDRVAGEEGFASWSLLAAREAATRPAAKLFAQLRPGDLVLLGARPGHGKTLLGLQLILEAIKSGHKGTFYTLEMNQKDVIKRLQQLGADSEALADACSIVTSDAISADYIIAHQQAARCGSLAVIDYLQILDQDRTKPDLATQIAALRAFAQQAKLILAFISQIDRSFDPLASRVPGMSDIRLPNPLDLTLFSKACFLNEGEIGFVALR
jgi:replicative DNA helicase